MDATPAIPFHAKVRIRSVTPETLTVNGSLGYIAGITERPLEDGRFGYGVFLYDLGRVWSCAEAELELTGEFDAEQQQISEQHRKRLAAKWGGSPAAG